MAITTVALSPYALLTDEDAVAYLRLAATPTGDNLQIFHRLINAATKKVEEYCKRPFISRQFDQVVDGSGTDRMALRYYPIVSVTTLEELDPLDGTVWQSYTGSDYRKDDETGFLILSSAAVFTKGFKNWHIVYNAGWSSLTTVPDDVVTACAMLLARMYRDHDQKRDDIESVSFDGQTTVFMKDEIPPRVRSLLNPWRITPLGVV